MAKEYSLKELSTLTNAFLIGDPSHVISGIAGLSEATAREVSFLADPKYTMQMTKSYAGVICIDEKTKTIPGKNFLVSSDPSKTFQIIVNALLSEENSETGFIGIHSTAMIHPSAELEENITIGPYAVIDQNVRIGKGTKIYPHSYIGSGTKIGKSCIIHSNVVIRERSLIGNRVIIQPGAVIGSCGFGYIPNKEGKHIKLEQLGIVVIEDDAEIGAGTTIDRARFKETRICKGTKIDNLVQIGHNVTLGENNIIVSQVGIAGSSKTGKNVVIGGQSGIVGHIEITDYVMICARSGISKSIKEKGSKHGGAPSLPLAEWRRKEIHLNHISEYAKKISFLENKMRELEKKLEELKSQNI